MARPDPNAVRRFVDQARSTWPRLAVDLPGFEESLNARLLSGASSLEGLRAGDLLLAYACARGDEEAIAVLEREFIGPAIAPLRKNRSFARIIEELEPVLLQKLVVAEPGQAPKISTYSGTAPLASWVRTVALRTAVSLQRREREPLAEDDELERERISGSDPELDFIQRRYRPAFNRAFRDALAGLPARDRTLLRMNLVEGLSIDQLAPVFRVHRSTAARWIARAKAELLDGVRRRLAEAIRIDRSELNSLMRALRSQLEVSLTRLLSGSVRSG